MSQQHDNRFNGGEKGYRKNINNRVRYIVMLI